MNDIRYAKIGDWICFDKYISDKKYSIYFNLKEKMLPLPCDNHEVWKGKAVIVPYNEIGEPEYHDEYLMEIDKYKEYHNAVIVNKLAVYNNALTHHKGIAATFIFDSVIKELESSTGKWIEFDYYEDLWNAQAIGKIKEVRETDFSINIKFDNLILISPTSINSKKDDHYDIAKYGLGEFKYKFISEDQAKNKINEEFLNLFK